MLPFLRQRRQNPGVSMKARTPDEPSESKDEGSEDQALHSAASDILQAVGENDPKKLAQALKAAFEICDAYPHEEGPHINEESEEEEE